MHVSGNWYIDITPPNLVLSQIIADDSLVLWASTCPLARIGAKSSSAVNDCGGSINVGRRNALICNFIYLWNTEVSKNVLVENSVSFKPVILA